MKPRLSPWLPSPRHLRDRLLTTDTVANDWLWLNHGSQRLVWSSPKYLIPLDFRALWFLHSSTQPEWQLWNASPPIAQEYVIQDTAFFFFFFLPGNRQLTVVHLAKLLIANISVTRGPTFCNVSDVTLGSEITFAFAHFSRFCFSSLFCKPPNSRPSPPIDRW